METGSEWSLPLLFNKQEEEVHKKAFKTICSSLDRPLATILFDFVLFLSEHEQIKYSSY